MPAFLTLLLTFLLTTILGGIFGAVIQQRAWRHKWKVEHDERILISATSTFEEVSSLMDKRLFRLTQLQIWTTHKDAERFKSALIDYREALFDWNDNINRILAKLQIYFGNDTRIILDEGVGKKFVEVGARLESQVRLFGKKGVKLETSDIQKGIEQLRSEVYDFNLKMLQEIERLGGNDDPKSLWEEFRLLFRSQR